MKLAGKLNYFVKLNILACIFCLPRSAHADDWFWSTELSFLSEYYSRGISQSKELPAPQLLSTLFHSSGFYTGVFASRVEFADGDEADQEIDFYFGVYEDIDNWNYKVGMIYYTYPNASDDLNYEFFEFDLALGYDFGPFASTVSLRLSPNYFANSGLTKYYTFETKIPVTDKVTAIGHVAYREIEDNTAFYGFPDNADWALGAEYQVTDHIKLIGKYVDSNFDTKTVCPDLCNERLIMGISYKF